MTQAEQDFVRWLAIAQPGQERPYPDSVEPLAGRAARAGLVARGWNERMGRYATRINYRIGEGLNNEP
jgi:hypothetical protein